MNFQQVLSGLFLVAVAAVGQADVLRVEAGVNTWQQDYAGRVQDGPDSLSLSDTLGYDDDNGINAYFVLEHPVPLLPNIRLQRTELESSGKNSLSEIVEFDGETYLAGVDVTSSLDLSHTDATLYYEVLDNLVSLDVGLTVRKFDGGIQLSAGDTSSGEVFDDLVPLVYVAVRVDLPLTGLYAAVDVNSLSVGDVSLVDYEASLGMELGMGLGLKLGYRDFDLEYEDDINEKADIQVNGLFVGAFLSF